jgi:hypothetical protein
VIFDFEPARLHRLWLECPKSKFAICFLNDAFRPKGTPCRLSGCHLAKKEREISAVPTEK